MHKVSQLQIPDFRKQDIWQQLGQAGQNVVNTIGGAYGGQPIGELAQEVPEVFNGIGAAQRAIQGYLGGSILNALSDPKHNVGQALIPNQTNVIFGLGGGLHGAGEPVEQSFPTNIANLDVKSPEYSEYRDRVANAISDNIDTIHQQATNNPLAVHSYGVLQDVADSIDKGKDTPDDLRLATETIKLHGVDINPQLQEAQSTIQAPEEDPFIKGLEEDQNKPISNVPDFQGIKGGPGIPGEKPKINISTPEQQPVNKITLPISGDTEAQRVQSAIFK